MTAWYSPICDVVLAKLVGWLDNYERGEVESTCKYHDPTQGIIDKPTRYIHHLIWHPREFEHLIRLLKDSCTNKPLVEEVEKVEKNILPKGKMLPGGHRFISLAFYPEHLKEMIKSLKRVRDGETTGPKTVAEQIKEGGLF